MRGGEKLKKFLTLVFAALALTVISVPSAPAAIFDFDAAVGGTGADQSIDFTQDGVTITVQSFARSIDSSGTYSFLPSVVWNSPNGLGVYNNDGTLGNVAAVDNYGLADNYTEWLAFSVDSSYYFSQITLNNLSTFESAFFLGADNANGTPGPNDQLLMPDPNGQTTDESVLAAPSVYDLPNSDYNFLLVGLRSDPDVGDFDFRIDQIEVTPVPVPAAVWLLGSGLFGLVGLRKKIKK